MEEPMKRLQCIILAMLVLLLPCSGCTTPMTGKVVDAETGQPIEGAIVLVEWTKVHGFGNTYTKSEKAAEVFSDKDGTVNLPGYNDPTVAKPDVTIYKPGYVAWNNRWIFPDTRKRTDFEWKSGYVFKLERFRPEYSFDLHTSFISSLIGTSMMEYKKNIKKSIQWEEEKAFNERKVKRQK
jgi:hypothetical protein